MKPRGTMLGLMLGMSVLGVFFVLRKPAAPQMTEPAAQPFVIHFRDFAALKPNIEPKDGVMIDAKSGTVTVDPKVQVVKVGFEGALRPKSCISVEVTFRTDEPIFPGAKQLEATFNKVGEITHSDVTMQEIDN